MTGVSASGLAASYAYTGLGDRLSQTVNSVTTNYTLDLNAGLTQVLQESAPQGYGTNTYLYGVKRIAQVSETQTGYFLPDALGSVRQMTDENGEVNLAQSYTPYGEVIASEGEATTAYAFTGENFDSQTGLVYLRARYLNVSDGRFLTEDMWAGDANMPMSYNTWLYGYSNPVTYADPSGLWSCRGHPDCKGWVENVLNTLSRTSETGLAVVNFFLEHDESIKRQQPWGYLGPDCSSLPYGAVIEFGNPWPAPSWGTSTFISVLQLSDDPKVINGNVPDGFGLQLFGHEVSHWAQGWVRFTIQGELLARYVEQQLRNDLEPEYGTIYGQGDTSSLVEGHNPFYIPHLENARRWMGEHFNPGYLLFPLPSIGGLDRSWLEKKFHVRIELPDIPPGPQPVPTPPTNPPPADTPVPPLRKTPWPSP